MDKNLNIHIKGNSASAERALAGVQGKVAGLANALATGLSVAVFDRVLRGLENIASGFENLVKRGVEFNATVQDARLGIAAVIKQFDDTGAIKNFDDAIRIADDALEQLKIEAKQSPATLQQLIQAFQGVSGAALGAGISVKDTVSLVTLMSQALAGLGIRSGQILQESRALLTGNITEDAAAAKILGITKAQIDQAKQQGQLYDFLTQKLGAFSEAASRGTRNYTTALANLEDAIDAVAGEATEEFFEALTKSILDLSDAFQSEGFKTGLTVLTNDLAKLVGILADISEWTIRNGDDVAGFYEKLKTAVMAAVPGLGYYVRLLDSGVPPAAKSAAKSTKEFGDEVEEADKKVKQLTESQKKLVDSIAGEFNEFGVDEAGRQILEFQSRMEALRKAFNVDQNGIENPEFVQAQDQLTEMYLARVRAIKDADKERRATALEDEEEFLDQLRADAISYSDDKEALIEKETELLKEHIRERITDAGRLNEALALAEEIRIQRLEQETEKVYELSDAYDRFIERTQNRLLSLQSVWSDVGANMADVMVNGVQASVRGVGDTIGDAIYTTGNWERTFARVSQSIVRGLINVVVEYVAQMTIVRALRRIMDAEQVASAGVRTAAEAPAATAASIGSYGAAAAIGVAALLAGIAVGVAAFQEGGKVRGGQQLIQVNEQGEEFVMNARATALLGENFLNQLQAAAELGTGMDQVMRTAPIYRGSGSGPASQPNVNVSAPPVYVVKVHDNETVIQTLRSQQGRKELYTLTREQAVQLGIAT